MTSEPASARASGDPATSQAIVAAANSGTSAASSQLDGSVGGGLHVAQHPPRVDVVAAHTGTADLGVQHADDPVRRRPPHRRSDAPRAGLGGILRGADRREVHHDAITALDHRRDQSLEQHEWVQRVGRQDALDEIDRHTEGGVVEARTLVAGAAHDDVDATERGECQISGPLDRHPVGEVHLDRDDAGAERPALLGGGAERADLLHAGRRIVEACPEIGRRPVGRPRRDHEVESVGGEGDRGRLTDAPAGAGDQCDTSAHALHCTAYGQ